MTFEPDRTENFLAKAKDADEMAAKAADANAKRSWTMIAQSYRELAMFSKHPAGKNKSEN